MTERKENGMEYSVLGKSDLRVSRICMGGAQIVEHGEGSMKKMEEMFCYAADAGVNFVDTARNYGESEETLGKLLKNRRDRFIIATKFSGREFDYGTVKEEISTSLKNLRTDYVDLYQIHWPKMKLLGARENMGPRDYDNIAGTMGRLKKEGMIRYAGVSNFRARHLEEFASEALDLIVSNQVPYSLLWRVYDVDGTAEFCQKHRINFMAYSPLVQGLLAGKFSAADAGTRETSVLFIEPVFAAALRIVDRVREIAEECGGTAAQVAIRWLMEKEIVSAAITGVRRKDHLRENVDALDLPLTEEQLREMDKISMDFQTRYLTAGLEQCTLWTEPEELEKAGIKRPAKN